VEIDERTVSTPDGRALSVLQSGDLDGAPVIVHHGTPMSRLPYAGWVDDAARDGVRLITFDRPGYGQSSPKPGRSVADVASDVVAIADDLGLEHFVTWGISGGGPHALACAALLRDRVAAAASLAGVAPRDAAGLDFLAGMGKDNVVEFSAAERGRATLEPLVAAMAKELSATDAAAVVAAMRSLLSPVDEAVLTGDVGEFFAANMAEAVRCGTAGWVDDDLAFVQDWGFRLADIEIPVVVWQGRQDLMVPFAHGEWLAENIPNVEAHLSDDDGHLTMVVRRVQETTAWLVGQLA